MNPTDAEIRTTIHYHAGYNMPGYLPENDEGTYAYSTADEAKRAMIGILDYHGDNEMSWIEEHDCDDIPCPTYGDECGWQLANNLSAEMEELNLADVSAGWDAWHGKLHYWITPCQESACVSHEGHDSLFGTWWCDTCNSAYCELA